MSLPDPPPTTEDEYVDLLHAFEETLTVPRPEDPCDLQYLRLLRDRVQLARRALAFVTEGGSNARSELRSVAGWLRTERTSLPPPGYDLHVPAL